MSNYLRRLTLQFGTYDPNRHAIIGRLVAPTVPIANLRRGPNEEFRVIRVSSTGQHVQYFRLFQLARTNANHFLFTSEHVFTANGHKVTSQNCHDRTGISFNKTQALNNLCLVIVI